MSDLEKFKERIYEPNQGKWVSYMEYAEMWSYEIADLEIKKLREERQQKDLKNVVDFKPRENVHKQHPIKGQFLPLEYERFFDNEKLLKVLAGKTMLFLILLKNVVDWDKNERLNLFQEYFTKRRLLVASISHAQLSRLLDCSGKTLKNWIKALEKDGLVTIERIVCNEEDDHRRKYNVYILGEVFNDGTYRFFYEKK